jgi:hypothetical protein
MKLSILFTAAAALLVAAPVQAFEPVPVVRHAVCSEAISNGASIELQNRVTEMREAGQKEISAVTDSDARQVRARYANAFFSGRIDSEAQKIEQYSLKRWKCLPQLRTPDYAFYRDF